MDNKKRLKYYLFKEKGKITLGVLLCLLYVVCQISQPFLLGRALDAVAINDQNIYLTYLIICLVLTIVGAIFYYFFEITIGYVSQNIIRDMRKDIYLKMNSVSIKEFDTRTHGDLLQLEIRDIENVANGIFAVFKTLFQGIFTIILTIVMMLVANWILALGVIILSPLSVIVSYFVSSFNHRHFKKQAELQSQINSISLEAIGNLELLQSLNYEEESLNKFKEVDKKLKKEGRVAQFSASWVNPSTRLVNNTIYVIIGVAGIIMLAFDMKLAAIFAVMTIGRLSSFLSYTTQYTRPFNDISNVVSEYEVAKSSFERVNNFLNMDNDIDEGKEEINNIDSIKLENVYFSYNPKYPLIENFSLDIKKGNKVAIVGPTGAGKTTLINIIMRFYEPNDGDIKINNISFKDIKKSSLRKSVGMVLQDTWIFHGTILDNVKYTKIDATKEEVIEACKKAHADGFINALPNGYDTYVDGKEGLSEGQKQMIAIARVMLRNPNLVILDEATSNIDTRSEMLITKAFDSMMKEKTSIVIAHRLSTIKSADTIIVMKDGHIIETGNHNDLMKAKGFYYKLYSSQFE
ncbi:MAG: ABC transporter ATP-binding protein/permease [Bacilli bacterium]|nr:ABC transporter ATP-binding protein/permease [Bacilli bacterium]